MCGGVKLQLGKVYFEVQRYYQSNTAKHGVNRPQKRAHNAQGISHFSVTNNHPDH